MFSRILNFATHRIYNLPVIVLMPHSSCNCRCIMCDIWKANHNKKEIPTELIEKHLDIFRKLGTREVVLSGGEALLHSNLWKLCDVLKTASIKITLLSTGLLLKKYAKEIIKHIDNVIISLDGSESIHNRIRNVPSGFQKIREGISELRNLSNRFRITGRCVLQRHNYRDLPNIILAAKTIGLDQISFLAADVSTSAFNRTGINETGPSGEIALGPEETQEFERVVRDTFRVFQKEYESRFIAESPAKMRRLVEYYKALNNMGDFPRVVCNAPWVSTVIETDGSVMPCFFHKPFGNIFEKDLMDILNSSDAIQWRKSLNMDTDPVCKKCVCSLKLGIRQMN